MEGFGQTETTLATRRTLSALTATPRFNGQAERSQYDIDMLLTADGKPVKTGETGEIVYPHTAKMFRLDSSLATTMTRKRPRRLGTTDSTTQATRLGRTRTAISGTLDVLTMLSSHQATVSDLSRSRASSWNFRMFSNAA